MANGGIGYISPTELVHGTCSVLTKCTMVKVLPARVCKVHISWWGSIVAEGMYQMLLEDSIVAGCRCTIVLLFLLSLINSIQIT